jgi:hypothetical protein
MRSASDLFLAGRQSSALPTRVAMPGSAGRSASLLQQVLRQRVWCHPCSAHLIAWVLVERSQRRGSTSVFVAISPGVR